MSIYLRVDTQKVLQTTLTGSNLYTLCLIILVMGTSFTLRFPFVLIEEYIMFLYLIKNFEALKKIYKSMLNFQFC